MDSLADNHVKEILDIMKCNSVLEEKIIRVLTIFDISIIVDTIFDESVKQPEICGSGAQFCGGISKYLKETTNGVNFRYMLLKKCKDTFIRRETLAEQDGQYLRGFSMFMAELFINLQTKDKQDSTLGNRVPYLIITLLKFPTPENKMLALKILKVVGKSLQDFQESKPANNGRAPEMNYIKTMLMKLDAADRTRLLRVDSNLTLWDDWKPARDIRTSPPITESVSQTRLLDALERQDAEGITSALNEGFHIDTNLNDQNNAISICVSNGWYEAAQFLIQSGCSLSLQNNRGETPLHLAVIKSDKELVKLIITHNGNQDIVDLQGKSALHHACHGDHLDIVMVLLEHSTPLTVNVKDNKKRNPLMYACLTGSPQVISQLLSRGAELNCADMYGDTPLLLLLSNPDCNSALVKLLLEKGADVNLRNLRNDTALLKTIIVYFSDVKEVCVDLIKNGSDLNSKNYLEETPLHLAVYQKDAALVKILLNSGCQVNVKNAVGLVPLYFAAMAGTQEIVNLIISCGGNLKYLYQQRRWLLRQEIPTWEYTLQNEVPFKPGYRLLKIVLDEGQQVTSLTNICRIVIRQAIGKNIETNSELLKLPKIVKSFIQLKAELPKYIWQRN